MRQSEIFVSVDIEANGPIPGPFSMLSLGAVALAPFEPGDSTTAFYQRPQPISTFEVNLELLPEAGEDPSTMRFWMKNQEAFLTTRENVQDPAVAMGRFCDWLEGLPGKPVFVGYPASFDFLFAYWYCIRFVGRCPFGFAALDMKTLAWALLGGQFRGMSKRRMPRGWFKGAPEHDHRALTDADGQAVLFGAMHEMLMATRLQHAQTDPRRMIRLGTPGYPDISG